MRRKEQALEDAQIWLAAPAEQKRRILGHEQIEEMARTIVAEAQTNSTTN